ncbi:MAG: amidoligase family protein, partial [Patescibacteria group bacterium]
MQGLIIDTVGVEIEGCFLNRDELIRNLSSKFGNDLFNKIQVSRDASVEMRVINNLNDSFVHHSRETRSISRGSGNVAGFELITYPLSIDEMEKIIFKVLPELSLMGEVESKRAALHVHVGFPSNLNSIKNLIKCGEILDPLLFKIAGFGKAYRGKINHSVYAFPITAGPIVKNRDNYYRILDIKKALKAESFQDFWKTYGISSDYAFPEVNRYSPGRYIAFNLFSMLLRQTVEFRHFNSTLNPTYAIAVIK